MDTTTILVSLLDERVSFVMVHLTNRKKPSCNHVNLAGELVYLCLSHPSAMHAMSSRVSHPRFHWNADQSLWKTTKHWLPTVHNLSILHTLPHTQIFFDPLMYLLIQVGGGLYSVGLQSTNKHTINTKKKKKKSLNCCSRGEPHYTVWLKIKSWKY